MSGRRLTLGLLAALAIGAAVFAIIGYTNATSAPLVRRLTLTVSGYPSGAAPVRIALFSDVHVHGPDMPPSRVARIVKLINGLHPDIDVAAGDFVGNNWFGRDYPIPDAIAPLGGLKARFGVFAVLGNNDYRAGGREVAAALEKAGVHVVRNGAVAAGPISLGGLDGRIQSHAAITRARQSAYQAVERTGGIKLLVAHRPDEFVAAPSSIGLVLAGHTHCGQIVLPLVGAMETGSDYGQKYVCGVYRDRSKVLVVTAGLGTSYVPLRIGAPPDVWLITVKGPAKR